MTRTRRVRLLLIGCAAAIPLLTSGCAILEFGGYGGTIGSPYQTVAICASGSTGNYTCREKGNLGLDATSGFRQLLLGAQIPADVGAPSSLVTPAPTAVTFSSSPGYAAELHRLQPAPAGRKWVGWISPTLNYDAANNTLAAQKLRVSADWQLPRAPDGSPYVPDTITSNWVVGIRNVTDVATPQRPVACGTSLTTSFADVEDPQNPGFVFCLDSQTDITSSASDYGVVTSGARASGPPGSLVSMPFILRSGNVPQGITPLPVRATSTLPGATLAAPPEALQQPPADGDSTAIVAVGIPARAAPGVYDVTFTVDLPPYGPGVSRTGVGRITVLAPPPGGGGGAGGGGGTPAKRKLTTVLPKGLPVSSALANGVPVLIGSNVAGPAVARLQQGPRRKPFVSVGKRIRLKVPGPVKVTFRSRKLAKGPYRVTIAVAGKVVRTASGRLVK